MSDTIFKNLDMVQPGDLVIYHGSQSEFHGYWIAVPCTCGFCKVLDKYGVADVRFDLINPRSEQRSGVFHVRRKSITRSITNA